MIKFYNYASNFYFSLLTAKNASNYDYILYYVILALQSQLDSVFFQNQLNRFDLTSLIHRSVKQIWVFLNIINIININCARSFIG